MVTKDEIEAAYLASSSPVYRVMDDEGRNMAEAKVRLTGLGWVYVDEVDGWSLISVNDDVIARWDRTGHLIKDHSTGGRGGD